MFTAAWRFMLVLWLFGALLAGSCISNPTPHPATDAGGAFASGSSDALAPPVARGGPGLAIDEGVRGQDAYKNNLDGEGDALDGEDVGPEDGGGITEPMG